MNLEIFKHHFMNKLLLTALFLFLLLIGAPAQNLLTNGGFEDWSTGTQPVTGWTIANVANGTVTQDTVRVEGSKSCSVYATGSNCEVYQQSVSVTPGKTYNLTVSYNVKNGDGTDAQLWSYFRGTGGAAIAQLLEDSLKLKGPGGASAYFPTIKNTWKTYTCRVVAPASAKTFRVGVRTYKAGTVLWDNMSLSEDLTPVINKSTTALGGFSYYQGAGPSADLSFTVSGSNLSSSIRVTAPANFEISTASGSSFVGVSSLSLAQSGGVVSPMTLYVRLKSGLSIGSYSGNLIMSSTGVTSDTIALSGDVIAAPPALTVSTTSLTGFAYAVGAGPSATKSFTVAGQYLSDALTVTAPSNYEVSVSSVAGFTSSVQLTPSSGRVSSTKLYIRLKAGLAIGSYSGNITISSVGVADKTIAVSGSVSSQPGLYVSATTITGLDYTVNGGPSAIQSFDVYGGSLTGFVSVFEPTNYFEISTDGGDSFLPVSLAVVSPVSGDVNSAVYARLASGLPVGKYSDSITITSSGVTTLYVHLYGEVKLVSAVDDATAEAIHVYARNGALVVDGAVRNEMIAVYDLSGRQVKALQSAGDRMVLNLPSNTVYLVRVNDKNFKVILR